MADWKSDRKPRVRQAELAEDEANPLWKIPSTTQPHLTLPSIPRVSAIPSQRLEPPRPRPSGRTGQQPAPTSGEQRSGQTGQYSMPSAAKPRSGQTGQYAAPSSSGRPSGLSGQQPTTTHPAQRSRQTGQYAAPSAAKPRSGQKTGQYPAPATGEHSSGLTGQHLTITSPKPAIPFGAGRSTGLIGRYAPSATSEHTAVPARPQTSTSRPLGATPGRVPAVARPQVQPWEEEAAAAPTSPNKAVTLIPGKQTSKALNQTPAAPRLTRQVVPRRGQAIFILCVLAALALGLVFGGVLKNGLEPLALNFSTSSTSGNAALQPTAGPTLPPGLNTTDTNYYINKYGFDAPGNVGAMSKDEQQRLTKMLPYAMTATARYDARYQAKVEPQMLLWWTHSEGIGARVNYSNCANESPPSGSYFVSIQNCDRPDFWQLGFGNQFGNIWVLKDAFTDMHGDPNDAALVQKVGQAVLDYDMSQHTTPACGGYSCTFPAKTIDQIMADVHWHASDHQETESNWWASVLSRDPGINSYMLALALTSFSHEQTRTWVGCYYAEPCWQRLSNAMAQILNAWKAMGG